MSALVREAALVGAGGALGSVARYLVGVALVRPSVQHAFPFATLAVNVLGCLAIGWLAAGRDARPFLVVGMLGGFTTFSAFGHDTLALVRGGAALHAAGNVLLNVALGLVAAGAGHALATR